MVIDSSVVIHNPHDGDLKIKKREDTEKIKPVEGSGKSDNPELDFEKDKIKEKTIQSHRFDVGAIYNKNGEIDGGWDNDEKTGMKAKTIDILV